MKNIKIFLCVLLSSVVHTKINAENHSSFAAFSHERVCDALKNIDHLYSLKNREVATKFLGIGLAASLGYWYLQTNNQNVAGINKDSVTNSWKDKITISLIDSSSGAILAGIGYSVLHIWKQFCNKPEYGYFIDKLHYFNVHLDRIKKTSKDYSEEKNNSIRLERLKNKVISSFNDMIYSLEEIIAIIDFASSREKQDNRSINLPLYNLLQEISLLEENLNRLIFEKEKNFLYLETIKGVDRVNSETQELINLEKALSDLQKESLMNQKIENLATDTEQLKAGMAFLIHQQKKREEA